jgi:hypothetical protein
VHSEGKASICIALRALCSNPAGAAGVQGWVLYEAVPENAAGAVCSGSPRAVSQGRERNGWIPLKLHVVSNATPSG